MPPDTNVATHLRPPRTSGSARPTSVCVTRVPRTASTMPETGEVHVSGAGRAVKVTSVSAGGTGRSLSNLLPDRQRPADRIPGPRCRKTTRLMQPDDAVTDRLGSGARRDAERGFRGAV